MIPVSYDGNAINDITNYESLIELDGYGLPLIDVVTARRQGAWPLVSGIKRDEKRISLQVFIRGASVDTLRKQLFQYFDYEDETPKKFIVEDFGGGNDRYVMAVCRGVFPDEIMPETCYHIALVLDGDIKWRETTPTAPSSWNITATGQTNVYANSGEIDCYPILKIKPTSAKTGSWPYKRFMVVKWRTGAASDYPVDIANDSLDTQIASTNFALASGDDLRVWVDGIEVDRWLDGPNTPTTKVWANLDFQADISMTLDGGIDISQTTLTVNESINSMPNTGILYIDSEAITYASKSNSAKTFYGCSRGAKGTTAAIHTNTTAVYWLQHEIWILYGNSGAGSPPADASTKPMFALASSTNTSWDYDDFNDIDPYWPFVAERSARWLFNSNDVTTQIYTATQYTYADPASVLGLYSTDFSAAKMWLDNPCGITNANFQNGYKRSSDITEWGTLENVYIGSDIGGVEYRVPAPSANDTWQTWSRNEALTTGAKQVYLWCQTDFFYDDYVEASDVTLTLNSSYTPVIAIGAEQTSYSLDCVITNNTTGDAIELNFVMEPNEDLEVDTDAKTVIYLNDNSNQFQALTVTAGPRRDWLPLQPGNNTFQFDDTGTNGVTIDLTYEERSYQ